MTLDLRSASKKKRRRRQREVGLDVRTSKHWNKAQGKEPMDNNEQTQTSTYTGDRSRQSRAKQVVDELTRPASFAEVASHELKRFAVWGPALFLTVVSGGATLMAIQRKIG